MNVLGLIFPRVQNDSKGNARRRRAAARPNLKALENRTVLSTYATTTVLTMTSAPNLKLTANVLIKGTNTGVPGGSVTFYDGATSLSTVTLNNHVAKLSLSSPVIATHVLTAHFNGDTTYITIVSPCRPSYPGSSFPGSSYPGRPTFPTTTTVPKDIYLASTSNALNGLFYAATLIDAGDLNISVSTGDVNGAGKADILASNHNNNGEPSLNIFLSKGDGTFAPKVGYDGGLHADQAKLIDMNADGKLGVLLNNGVGTLRAVTNYTATGGVFWATVADVNSDGKPDLIAATWDNREGNIFLNKGNGTFAAPTTFPLGYNVTHLAVGDLNADGRPDLVASNTGDGNIGVLLGKGDGTFAPQVTYAAPSATNAVIADMDKDGKLNVVVTNFNDGPVSIFTGKGDGTLGTREVYAAGRGPIGVTIGDFNGDGLLDIVTANRNDHSISILLGNLRKN